MAHMRVFVSSTYYDLKQVRAELEQFIKRMGYDAILNERGLIPYASDKSPEEGAYSEVKNCDMLISIIGGRFGHNSSYSKYSISQQELRTAIEDGIQVFIFIEKAVYLEYQLYLKNKDNGEIVYPNTEDIKVFSFIEEIENLPLNNAIQHFEMASDITQYLQEQWSGLFQRYLRENREQTYRVPVQELQAASVALRDLAKGMSTKQDPGANKDYETVLLVNHPLFNRLQSLLNIPYRVFFTNHQEFSDWMKARGWQEVQQGAWDDEEHEEWIRKKKYVAVHQSLFKDDGSLRMIRDSDWVESWVRLNDYYEEEPLPQP